MKQEVLIGIDAGSTHLKAALYETNGKLIRICHRRVRVCHSIPEYSEYDADEIYLQLCSCLDELLTPQYLPVAVGISSFGESIVPIDPQGKPVDRMIAWYDMRGQHLINTLSEQFGYTDLYSLTGQSPSGKFTLAKLLWLKENKPELIRQTLCFLFMQDYLAFRLTGNLCTEYSLASRSMLFDTTQSDWSEKLLAACGIKKQQLPVVIPSGSSAGTVTGAAAKITGLPQGIPVILAGHDHASASIAAGITGTEVILDSMGTSETSVFTSASIEKTSIEKQSLLLNNIGFYPYYKKQNRYISSIQGCGYSIEWLAGILFEERIFEKFFSCAGQFIKNNSDAPLFLPYLRGLQESPNATAAFWGLKDIHTRESLCYSVLEGLCFEYKRRIINAQACTKTVFSTVRAVGRLSKEPVFMQLKADVLEKPVEILAEPEAVSQGAAILAGRYCQCIDNLEPDISMVYTPRDTKLSLNSRFADYLEKTAKLH